MSDSQSEINIVYYETLYFGIYGVYLKSDFCQLDGKQSSTEPVLSMLCVLFTVKTKIISIFFTQ